MKSIILMKFTMFAFLTPPREASQEHSPARSAARNSRFGRFGAGLAPFWRRFGARQGLRGARSRRTEPLFATEKALRGARSRRIERVFASDTALRGALLSPPGEAPAGTHYSLKRLQKLPLWAGTGSRGALCGPFRRGPFREPFR